MTNRYTRSVIGLAVVALAACGGSDDDPAASADEAVQAEEPGSDASVAPNDAESNDPAPADDQSDADQSDAAPGDDATSDGAGGDGATGDDASPGSDLEVSMFGDLRGGGVVTIDGVPYTFVSNGACIVDEYDENSPSFTAAGIGEDPDGNQAWVDVSISLVGQSDGSALVDGGVSVDVGRLSLTDRSPGDVPEYFSGPTLTFYEFEFELDESGRSVSGSGLVDDSNYVALPAGEYAPMTFEASCPE